MHRPARTFLALAVTSAALLGLTNPPADPAPLVVTAAPSAEELVRWDARAAEHLLDRAGFGGTGADVQKLVALGRTAAVDSFFRDPGVVAQPDILNQVTLHAGLEAPEERLATVEGRRTGFARLQTDLIVALNCYCDWWIERMVRSEDPLRDRMTIFWHGHFVSSIKEVANSQDMIRQVRFLREHALGGFETLVRGIGRDPAMLRYLNNDTNVQDHPNENWARELMELFTLGDGNYTETDIKQAARAFTGWSRDLEGFEYKRLDHDFGDKTVLSVDGNLDGDQVIGIVLGQPACAPFIARKLIAYFEGVPPAPERVADYADFLRKNGYDIGKMLHRLFLDPAFYRAEIVGNRVTAPVEYLVGCARRLGLDPPGQLVMNAGDILGQRLFWPPSVKGWEEGLAWMTTSSLMQRSNMVGVMLGLVDVRALMHDDEFMGVAPDKMAGAATQISRTNGFNHIRYIQQMGWTPDISLVDRVTSGLVRAEPSQKRPGDEAIATWLVGELLAIPYAPETSREPYEWLKAQREKAGIAEGALLENPQRAEPILRGLAHLILSMPEAQLN